MMERVIIGRNFYAQPGWKRMVSVPLIYLPLLTTVPFLIVAVILIKFHLKYVGGLNIRPYWSFVPTWVSHRYRYEDQITFQTGTNRFQLQAQRWFWIFNCKVYCPMSVALLRYTVYLVEIVENWWCPFHHEKKHEYREGAIDQSYWHIHEAERRMLHPEDRDNPIWNDEAEKEAMKMRPS